MPLSPQMQAAHNAVRVASGPMAKVYGCPYCRFVVRLPKTGPERIRGPHAWLAYSAGAKSHTAAHIRREHADKLGIAAGHAA